MTANRLRIVYLIFDWLGVLISWFAYCYMRYVVLDLEKDYNSFLGFLTISPVIFNGFIVSLFCLFIFFLSGYYNKVFRKSRASELIVTFMSIVVASLGILIGVLLDDLFQNPHAVYLLMTGLFLILFIFVYTPRLIITTLISQKIFDKKLYTNALILGTGKRAKRLVEEFQKAKRSMGYNVIGCIDLGEQCPTKVDKKTILGKVDVIGELIELYGIEDLILAPDLLNSNDVLPIMYQLYRHSIPVLMLRDEPDLLTGKSDSVGDIYSWVVLSNLTEPPISESEKNIKLISDYLFSGLALVITAPLFLLIGILVKSTTKGPCFYTQERVGKNGKIFKMYKFRTMIVDSEPMTPLLSSPFDDRITDVGRILRRYRIDELPQLINIIKGDMSIVGPRPEREYYIEQIVERAPYYRLLQRVKPGLTSWGMVKYGYAQNVDEMIERLYYDMRYVENCSLSLDIKIILNTISVVFSGRGL